MDTQERIRKVIEENSVMLFMKGSPDFPQCGFSGRVVQILEACGTEFGSTDVLKDPEPRIRFRKFSSSGLKLQLLFWIFKPAIRGRTVDAVNTDIYKTFAKRNIIIPYPTVNLITKDS